MITLGHFNFAVLAVVLAFLLFWGGTEGMKDLESLANMQSIISKELGVNDIVVSGDVTAEGLGDMDVSCDGEATLGVVKSQVTNCKTATVSTKIKYKDLKPSDKTAKFAADRDKKRKSRARSSTRSRSVPEKVLSALTFGLF